ncbi:MAG: multicopper oxidase domain-containing protein [Actinobacteria bacterium]|nr:multicopper oxidase domain-containing protein [Actinomycetota bacterium]
MSARSQTLLTRLALATSIFALLVAAIVAVTNDGGGGGGSDGGAVASGPVSVTLTEFSISPATINVPKGGSLAIQNDGKIVHNFQVTGTDVKSKDIDGGSSETIDVSSLAPGSYEVFCAIPGHKDSGMTATLVVSDGGAGGEVAGSSVPENPSTSHSIDDIATLEASDPVAKQINADMEKSMDAGVAKFLEFADKYAAGDMKAGNQKIKPTILPDGTKRFNITAAVTDWEVSPGNVVKAWTYNGTVPGPWIRVEPGDKVEVVLRNELPISTDIHWHGISVPNDQDGVAGITQDYIRPLTSYTYKWTAPDHSELAMWHAHNHGNPAVLNGLFAVVQVGDVPLPAPKKYYTMEVPADLKVSQEIPIVLNDAGVIGLSINGKSFPETAAIGAKPGDWILMHYYNEGLVGHPMHLHRQPQLVVAKDGFPLDAPYQMDTIWVGPGERYSVLVHATEPGVWAFHCHILNHAENDDGLFGMVTALVVK